MCHGGPATTDHLAARPSAPLGRFQLAAMGSPRICLWDGILALAREVSSPKSESPLSTWDWGIVWK